jgi:putative DNA primase/helicase
MTLHDAMAQACAEVGIKPPRRPYPGKWAHTDTHEKNGKGDGRVLIFDDETGGIVFNWQTGVQKRFTVNGTGEGKTAPRARDPEKERQREAEAREVLDVCERIVKACRQDRHAYLARKGFPDEIGLVIYHPSDHMPERLARALPQGEGPFLIVPGRIDGKLTTVQFITAEGEKKNILGGQMGGAAHRIATGRETWVCEGIATALSVRAALRLLGRSATVLSAFSASNVAKVAKGIPGSVIAADHDKPLEQLHGLGTGEFYARASERVWVMPPERGDFNDMHVSAGLRAVAVLLREVRAG